jgi:hypothetical protein
MTARRDIEPDLGSGLPSNHAIFESPIVRSEQIDGLFAQGRAVQRLFSQFFSY